MGERVRTTISVDSEVLAVFKRMADAANMSTSKAMGEWLADTADGAEMIVLKMEEAKRAPMAVMREMQAVIAGMSVGVDQTIADIRGARPAAAARADARQVRSGGAVPPSSNTGVKVPLAPSLSRRNKP